MRCRSVSPQSRLFRECSHTRHHFSSLRRREPLGGIHLGVHTPMVYSIDDNVFVVAGHVKLSLEHSNTTLYS